MMHLVIVDDEEGVRRSLKRALEKEGYRIVLASSGAEAIEIIRNHDGVIEMVISDFRMPGMSGLETLVEVGKMNPEITRIILTGYATMETAIESVNEGIDGFLMKPFSNSELRAKVREYLLKKRLRQFVSEQVYREMQQGPEWMDSRHCRATVLFCDIRGFSRLSEELANDELSMLLNRGFFSPLDEIVCDCGGMLDKHIGDSIMAVFGIFGDEDRAPHNALACGTRMVEYIARGVTDGGPLSLQIGIGISTGNVIAGMFGSSRKKEYTVFGSPVNRAARLEGMAQSGEMLICGETRRLLGDAVIAEERDPGVLKEGKGAHAVFAVISQEIGKMP